MASFIPAVSGPHAVVWADRAASSSVLCEAVAQLRLPLYSTQTSHSTFWADSVDQARKPAKASTAAVQPSVFVVIGAAPLLVVYRPAVSSPRLPSLIAVTWVRQPPTK